jgi:ubiquinone/menaquinone biosynthesis C-methylase UbiE
VRDAYERAARRYDRFIGPVVASVRRTALEMFPPYAGMRVLDVGCGTGAQLAAYRDAGCAVSCVDRSEGMLRVARRRLGPDADVREGSGVEIPFRDDSFDLATISFVLHEMTPAVRDSTFHELRRVVRPDGGVLVIDFLPCPYRGFRGLLVRSGIAAIEIGAGREHWANHRDFLRRGGVDSLANAHGMPIRARSTTGGGTLAVTLLGL